MSSRSKCAFSNCKNSLAKTPHLSFHRFPKNESLATEWIIRSGNNDLFELNPKQLHQKRLCSEHFDPNCFIVNQPGRKRRLYHNALPRIMLYDNESKSNNYVEMNDVSTSSMSLLQCETSSMLQKTNLNADFLMPLTSISTSCNEMSSMSLLKVTTPIKRTYSNTNLLNKKLVILEKKLKNARKIIKNLRQTCPKNKSLTVSIKTFLKDAEKFLNKNQLLLLKKQLSRNKTKNVKRISLKQRFATLLCDMSPNFLCNKNKNKSSLQISNSELSTDS